MASVRRLDQNVVPHDVDVLPLRVEANITDHFCPLCDCTKSGYATGPNLRSEWCEDQYCPCHDEEELPGDAVAP